MGDSPRMFTRVIICEGERNAAGQVHVKGHSLHLQRQRQSEKEVEEEVEIPLTIVSSVERLPPQTLPHDFAALAKRLSIPASPGLLVFPIAVKRHDFVKTWLWMFDEREAIDLVDTMMLSACLTSPKELPAYRRPPQEVISDFNGWHVYGRRREFERMLGVRTNAWRWTDINKTYTLCPTYPAELMVPSATQDEDLWNAAKYRSKARIPVLSYLHWGNMATITRSSQPMPGLTLTRSQHDEQLISAIFATNLPAPLANGQIIYGSKAANLIIDARPAANAMVMTAMGAGTENMENYKMCTKLYMGIDNIHVVRDSLNRLYDVINGSEPLNTAIGRQALARTNWLKHLSSIIDATNIIIKNVHIYNSHVLVHCSDGWDRTAQLVALSELCMDPYYRTLIGFQVLIEKEWISFGHKFTDRCGHLAQDKSFLNLQSMNATGPASALKDMQQKLYNSKFYSRETSPIFHQFLDCVFQIHRQYPQRFEFNAAFLKELHYQVYACQYGTFLFNCERERIAANAETQTKSVWDYFQIHRDKYINLEFQPKEMDFGVDGSVLFPSSKNLMYWADLFHLSETELNSEVKDDLLMQHMSTVSSGSASSLIGTDPLDNAATAPGTSGPNNREKQQEMTANGDSMVEESSSSSRTASSLDLGGDLAPIRPTTIGSKLAGRLAQLRLGMEDVVYGRGRSRSEEQTQGNDVIHTDGTNHPVKRSSSVSEGVQVSPITEQPIVAETTRLSRPPTTNTAIPRSTEETTLSTSVDAMSRTPSSSSVTIAT